ncbi:MAG: response regulator [Bryobacterales bacterium]|nr:response regulator [Bryobacterales bacterium]
MRTSAAVVGAVWLLCVGVAPLAGGLSTFEYFGQEQGLSHSVIRALAQDRDLALWIGTREGLFRYDGHAFSRFDTAHGLPHSHIYDIHIDPKGRLVVATANGFALRDGAGFRRLDLPAPAEGAREVMDSAPGGNLYWATSDGLAAEDTDGRVRWLVRGTPVRSVRVDGESGVWFGCGQEICRWNAEQLTRFGAAQGAGSGPFESFVRDKAGRLWARAGERLFTWNGGGFTVYGDRQFRGVGIVSTGPEGRLLVTTEDGLWLQQETGRWTRLAEEHGLPAGRVRTVLHDHEGSLWIGFADAGIARLRGQGRWDSWTRGHGLPSSEITAITSGPDGVLWAGTRMGVARKLPGSERWEPFGPSVGPAAEVRSLVLTANSLWVITPRAGLYRLDPQTLAYQEVRPESGLTSRMLLHAGLYPDGRLWVTSRDGVFVQAKAGPQARFVPTFAGEVGREAIYALAADKNGVHWLAGPRGLWRVDVGGSGTRRIGRADGLLAEDLVFATLGPDDALWVGYAGVMGVTRLRWDEARAQVQATHFDRHGPLRSNDICGLLVDRRGWLWVATDNGIDVYNGQRWRHIGSRDGLIWHDVVRNALVEDAQGNIWVGTNRGLSRYRPAADFFDTQPPQPAISSVQFGDRAEPGLGPFVIDYQRRSLEVAFTARTYARAHDVRFRYRLPGLTDNWIETGERSAMFPNLDPGRYRFEVQAGTDGVYRDQPAVFEFEIQTPWWRSAWFAGLLISLVLALAVLLVHQRATMVRHRHQELEEAVRQRTAELEEAKNRTEAEKRAVEHHKQEIEKLLAQARESSRLKGEFLANVSHEIRTPMNGILGMTTLALDTPLTGDQRDYLEAVRSSGESLLALLNDILDFSKMEAERMELEREPFAIRACLGGALQTVRAQAQAKGLELILLSAANLPEYVRGDALRLRQVLLNLLSNAVKFTEHGRVELRAELDEATAPGMVMLRFAVTDTGDGIPADKLDVIFQAFRQVDGSTTRKHGGTGLGLAICSRLVSLMGGRIWAQSHPGRGSVFCFTARFGLAASPGEREELEESRQLNSLAHAVQHGGTRRLRVLVAEDNTINQRLLVRILEKLGHDSEIASAGDQALALTAQRHFDLVLMDVQMPGLDGVEATRQIRERERTTGGHLPVLMLTASAMAGDRERCLAAGADGYLPKPLDVARLVEAIEEIAAKQPENRTSAG